jgi:hypothetical protein
MCAPPLVRSSRPKGGAFHALAVDHAGGWTGLPIDQPAAFLVEFKMNFQQRPVVLPASEVVEQRTSRRQVPGDIAPLTPGAQNVQKAIQYLAFIDFAAAATALGWRDEVFQVPPFLDGQVTWIAQLVPVVPGTVLRCPHHAPRESMPSSNHSRVNGFKPSVLTDSKASGSSRTDTQAISGLARLRGLAGFRRVRSWKINKSAEKVFTTATGGYSASDVSRCSDLYRGRLPGRFGRT